MVLVNPRKPIHCDNLMKDEARYPRGDLFRALFDELFSLGLTLPIALGRTAIPGNCRASRAQWKAWGAFRACIVQTGMD